MSTFSWQFIGMSVVLLCCVHALSMGSGGQDYDQQMSVISKTPEFELYQQFKDRHFRERNYGINDTVVQFQLNEETGKPNLVLFSRDRGKIQWYEYTYDTEQWFDYTVEQQEDGLRIVCQRDGLNRLYRISYPWQKDVHNHPDFHTKRYSIRERILETELSNEWFGDIRFAGETKVVQQTPYATSYWLMNDKKTMIMSPDSAYPCKMILVENKPEFFSILEN